MPDQPSSAPDRLTPTRRAWLRRGARYRRSTRVIASPVAWRAWLRHQLIGLPDIQAMYAAKVGHDVSRQFVQRLTVHPQFPRPVVPVSQGKLWMRDEVTAFLAIDRPRGRRAADA